MKRLLTRYHKSKNLLSSPFNNQCHLRLPLPNLYNFPSYLLQLWAQLIEPTRVSSGKYSEMLTLVNYEKMDSPTQRINSDESFARLECGNLLKYKEFQHARMKSATKRIKAGQTR